MRKAVSEAPPAGEFAFDVHDRVMLDPRQLNPAPYNPKGNDPATIERLKAQFKARGFIVPIIVQKHSPQHGDFVIVDGHQRIKAARELAIEDNRPLPMLPCVVLDLTDREAKKLNITLEKLGVEHDPRLLSEVLEDLNDEQKLTTEEVDLMGFGEEEYARFVHATDPPAPGDEEVPVFGRSVTLSLEFKDVRMRDAVKAAIEKRVKLGKRTSGEVVNELLGMKRKRG